jgi:hypothetical protein
MTQEKLSSIKSYRIEFNGGFPFLVEIEKINNKFRVDVYKNNSDDSDSDSVMNYCLVLMHCLFLLPCSQFEKCRRL